MHKNALNSSCILHYETQNVNHMLHHDANNLPDCGDIDLEDMTRWGCRIGGRSVGVPCRLIASAVFLEVGGGQKTYLLAPAFVAGADGIAVAIDRGEASTGVVVSATN